MPLIIIAPSYVIESRVSLGQAAREHTRHILNEKTKDEKVTIESDRVNNDSNKTTRDGDNQDCFQSGKFTFEPEFKPIQKAVAATQQDLIDSGVSFGAGHKLGLSTAGER